MNEIAQTLLSISSANEGGLIISWILTVMVWQRMSMHQKRCEARHENCEKSLKNTRIAIAKLYGQIMVLQGRRDVETPNLEELFKDE